jgi:hypothetical protein
VSSQETQAVLRREQGKVVSYQAEGMEEPYQAAEGKAASYLEENLQGPGNRAGEAWSQVNIRYEIDTIAKDLPGRHAGECGREGRCSWESARRRWEAREGGRRT